MNFYLGSCTVLFFCLTSLDAVSFRCDYEYVKDVGWFRYNEIPMTWKDARTQCRLEGTMLASPTTAEIKAMMRKAVRALPLFTGIHATIYKGHYHSIDGIPLSSITRIWDDSYTLGWEPDNKNDSERCISINFEGKLSDVDCYHLDNRTNKCYKFHIKPRKFDRAFMACNAEGGHLAIINSEKESKVITELFAQHPANMIHGDFRKDYAFIGFHNWDECIDWITIDGRSIQEAGFSTFAKGKAENITDGEEYCGSVTRDGLLYGVQCKLIRPFICEKDPSIPTLCHYNSNVKAT